MPRLQGKVAVITGGARGLGEAIARRMVDEGASVAILDRDPHGEQVAKDIGESAVFRTCDVTQEADVAGALDAVADQLGRIDVLVNNAGIAGVNKPTHEITEAEWDAVQAVNVKGVFFCTKHVIPHLKRAGGGSIVNLSSIYGLVGAPDVPPYHASKGAVTLMTRTDALLYANDRIRVNSVHPGYVWTPLVERHLREAGTTDREASRGRRAPSARAHG